jgi:hypothetical protein
VEEVVLLLGGAHLLLGQGGEVALFHHEQERLEETTFGGFELLRGETLEEFGGDAGFEDLVVPLDRLDEGVELEVVDRLDQAEEIAVEVELVGVRQLEAEPLPEAMLADRNVVLVIGADSARNIGRRGRGGQGFSPTRRCWFLPRCAPVC